MNILDFYKWKYIINEGFTADVEDDKSNNNTDEKNEIEIEIEKDHNVTYTIIGDRVTSKEIIKNKDTTNNTIGYSQNIIDVDDIKLKKDIINASNAIKDIKERERAQEIFRLTGGDENTPVSKKLIDIYDDANSNEIRRKHTNDKGETIDYSLYTELETSTPNFYKTTGAYCYLPLNGITGQNNTSTDITSTYNDMIINTVGKGEFLLPLIFTDVYKHKSHGYKKYNNDVLSIGDNYILHVDNKNIEYTYDIEVKSPNATLTFKNDNSPNNYIITYNDEYIENDENVENNYKKAIAYSFVEYGKRQNKNRNNLYMCIFHVEKNTPMGMLFINISNLKDYTNIFDTFKDLIYIDTTDTSSKKDFKYTVMLDSDGNPKIKCNLHMSHLSYDTNVNIKNMRKEKRKRKSKILSRDNFVNEIYTK